MLANTVEKLRYEAASKSPLIFFEGKVRNQKSPTRPKSHLSELSCVARDPLKSRILNSAQNAKNIQHLVVDGVFQQGVMGRLLFVEAHSVGSLKRGLEVSMDETLICVVDRHGSVVLETKTTTSPAAIAAGLAKAPECKRIVFETGRMREQNPMSLLGVIPKRACRLLCFYVSENVLNAYA
jgi:hypothetical protein